MRLLAIRWSLVVLPSIVLPVAACSSAPEPTGSTAEGAVAAVTPAAASADAAEQARIQQFLDSRYTRADVRDTFRTKLGDDIDCVDFFAEPGVRVMAARGQPITSIPKPPPLPKSKRPTGAQDDAPRGIVDDQGRARTCPEGSVPEMRITPERIARAGGLDGFLAAQGKKTIPAPPDRCLGEEYEGYAHVKNTLVNAVPPLEYGTDFMAIYAPQLPIWEQTGDHSLAQVWFYSGNHAVAPLDPVGCTSADCYNTIEGGWQVNAQLNPGDGTPRLFIGGTSNGYASFCFNNTGSDCTTWIPTNVNYYLNQPLNYTLPAAGSTPDELEFTIIEIAGDFWITIQQTGGPSEYIGYFPSGQYDRPMDTFEVGGEVYDQTAVFANTVQMGSGQNATMGYGYAAYHHDYAGLSYPNSVQEWSGAGTMCDTHPADYDYTQSGGLSSWDQYFFYGDCVQTSCPFLWFWNANTCACEREIFHY